MKKSSRQVIFINTAPPNERLQLLKPISEFEEMEDDSEAIYTGGLLQRYARRPANLEHTLKTLNQNSKVDEFNARESKIAVNADVKAEMQRLLEKGVSNFL